ncbi:tripartite tricarboxylate transporter substrate binding protein [Piscinibacter sp. HJYY11]|uniref:Bug family tripartite tricarboxylate transporter substrate binding protein n=1 Tax=Piscinibacter sp. HJYY11 TaxID=2801333 RepID=UPI00191FAD51|nr:tripartite tricarboxylate transporter substrate binding protein [Piscinibacter sp. HJYY11]MBL0726332.1 tripartite tricarboxylate transporter substrate binding protein [Piscinibacter sp. HJYY11]
MTKLRVLLMAVAALMLTDVPARAQTYPVKPITWVVPFTPGGVTDTTSRAISKKMGEVLGQSFVVENRPGVGGSLATEQVMSAAPDGYTVLYATSGTMAANLALYKTLKYQPLRDFIPVHGMFMSPTVLVVEASRPYKTMKELIDYAKANPGTLNYGSAGPGTGTHLTSEMVQAKTGTKMTHVPYKGSTPALQDLLGGRLDLMYDYTVTLLPHIKSGKLRPLVVMGTKRLPALPDVPTIAEAGFPGLESSSWSGIVVPAETPAPIVRKLSAAMHTALTDKAVVAPFEEIGSQPLVGYDEQKFKAFIADEMKKWAEVVKVSGATLN